MTADRTITLERVVRAPPATVWRCWSDPRLLPQWFGPAGYSCRTKEIDLRAGGIWRFDMIGPDGTIWPNRHRYTRFEAPQRFNFLMDDDTDAAPPFEVTVTLTAAPEGTHYVQVMTFPTAAIKAAVEGYGAVELGKTTLAKLAALAEKLG
jgi:uncharacterized protein YndB with AHSA1/START domain